MSWQGVFGADEVALQFARANRRGRLGGSFLFVGPSGVGKRTFAFALAKTLLCRRHFPIAETLLEPVATSLEELPSEEELARFQPCGECECCRQFELRSNSSDVLIPTHPDFHYVCKPPERSLLPLELLIGDRESRSRSGLCFELNQTAYMGGRKVAIIDDADYFNVEGANALLKTLEEPPANTIIILIGTSAAKQLPTIRSRCQIFRFQPLTQQALASILLSRGLVDSQEDAARIAEQAEGSLAEASRSLDSGFVEYRERFLRKLSSPNLSGVELATGLNEFVESAGKEAQLRRARLRDVLQLAIDFYRNMLLESDSPEKDSKSDVAFASLERTLDALDEVDRNVNLPFIVEDWAYRLANIRREYA